MRDNRRGVTLLSGLALLAAGYYWILPAEKAIQATNARADAALQKALADERALADEPRVRLLAQHIRAALKNLRFRSVVADTNQALLGDLQTAADRNNLTLTGLKPAAQESEISVRGSYRDIISFLHDLSHMPTPVRVLNVQLDRTNTNDLTGAPPSLDAEIAVQTIRLEPTIILRNAFPISQAVARRDPFVSDETPAPSGNAQSAGFMPGVQPTTLPMIPTPTASMHPSAGPRDGLRGIVVGEHPYALVNIDGKTRVISIGDAFDGRKIVSITLQGVTFDDRSIARIPLLDQ